MTYRVSLLVSILKGKSKLSDPEAEVQNISIDSRGLLNPETTLFFAIYGPRNDGHHYMAELVEKGVKNFVAQHVPDGLETQDLNIILVGDTLEALQNLSVYHRNRYRYPVIGITGSNGKTIVKEWLYQLLAKHYQIVRSPKSYNSQVGVPLSVLKMDEKSSLGIFEAGISMPGEMERIAKIIKPEIGIFTTLGDAHSENFESATQKAEEKFKLFQSCDTLIAGSDVIQTHGLLQAWKRSHPGGKLLTWSFSDASADLFLKKSEAIEPAKPGIKKREQHSGESTELVALYEGRHIPLSLPFYDKASQENIACCILACLKLGMPMEEIVQNIKDLQPVEMRLQKIEGIHSTVLINDTYNSDINSLGISVDYFTRQESGKNHTLILTDILQTEKSDAELYKAVNSILKSKSINRFIGIGPKLKANSNLIEIENKSFFDSTEHFLKTFNTKHFRNEIILFKGARTFGLEKVVKLLEYQSHQTVFEINLSAIESNFRYFKSIIPRECKVMAMVKAYSYGSGSYELARFLEDAGTDYLAVAYTDEGVALREKGIRSPIMVMNPDWRSFETMLKYDLEPEIYSFEILKAYEKACLEYGKWNGIHIELDTGMYRLGFSEADLSQLEAMLSMRTEIQVKSIFSHLAGSDEARLRDFTLHQISLFKEYASVLTRRMSPKPLLHILNSTGILHYQEGVMNMVRLGIGLHGIDPSDFNQTKLAPAGSLKSYISQIKKVRPNEGVSYGLHSRSKKERTIAVVAMGYADGLSRKLSNGNWQVLIRGQKAKTVGKICMDMFMVDTSKINCKVGDDVIIMGAQNDLVSMARKIGTIPYEVLTSISPRVKRIYWYE